MMCEGEAILLSGCTGLFIGHPGHELRIYGWVERTKPLVLAITDGSGGVKADRTESSRTLLAETGAKAGPIFGRLSDKEAYSAILRKDVGLFTGLAEEAADIYDRAGVTVVVSDAAEGFNPVHDLCRLMADAAVRLMEGRRQARVPVYEFDLVTPPWETQACDAEIRINLTDGEFRRKIEAAERYKELRGEIKRVLENTPADAFREEIFRPGGRRLGPPGKPFYESFGECRIAEGLYDQVIRRDIHLKPIAEALAGLGRLARGWQREASQDSHRQYHHGGPDRD